MGSNAFPASGSFKSVCSACSGLDVTYVTQSPNACNRKGPEVVNIIRKEVARMTFRFKEWRAAQRWRILRRYRP